MRKLSKISESIFNAGVDRNQGNSVRKEDEINWIDFGDFYIADRLYSKDGNIYFTYDETMKMFPEGREIELPNEDIIHKLKCTKEGNEVCISGPNGQKITLPLSGANDYPESKTQTIVWIYGVSKNHPDKNVRCALFRGKDVATHNIGNKGEEVATHDIVNSAKVCILLIKKKKMNESIFNAGIERNQGNDKKQEDKSRFDEAFERIKNAELVDLGFVSDILWTPFNFGASDVNEPGDYMSASDMLELHEYLKNTDYRIATNPDFVKLGRCYIDQEKIDGYWHLIFKKNLDGPELHLPNFGAISNYSAKKGTSKVEGLTKNQSAYYGGLNEYMADTFYAYTAIKLKNFHYICERHMNRVEDSDLVQVRLVKKKS